MKKIIISICLFLFLGYSATAQFWLEPEEVKIYTVDNHQYKWVDFGGVVWLYRTSTWCVETENKCPDGKSVDVSLDGIVEPTDYFAKVKSIYEQTFTSSQRQSLSGDKLRGYLYVDSSGSVIGVNFEFSLMGNKFSEIPVSTYSKFEDNLKSLKFTITDEGKRRLYTFTTFRVGP